MDTTDDEYERESARDEQTSDGAVGRDENGAVTPGGSGGSRPVSDDAMSGYNDYTAVNPGGTSVDGADADDEASATDE